MNFKEELNNVITLCTDILEKHDTTNDNEIISMIANILHSLSNVVNTYLLNEVKKVAKTGPILVVCQGTSNDFFLHTSNSFPSCIDINIYNTIKQNYNLLLSNHPDTFSVRPQLVISTIPNPDAYDYLKSGEIYNIAISNTISTPFFHNSKVLYALISLI